MKSKFGVAMVSALAIIFSAGLGRAAWDEATLAGRVQVTSPDAGVSKIEIFKAADAAVYSVVVDYAGGPLPPTKTLILEFAPPESGRVHASFFQGRLGLPFQTKPAWVANLSEIPGQTQFAIWQESSGEWGALIALVGGGCRTFLEGSGEKVAAITDSLANNFTPRRAPVFAIGWGRDPYQLVHAIYVQGFSTMRAVDPQGVIGKLRAEKAYPEIFRYVGWCSWNAHYRDIDEAKLIAHARSFQAAGFPMRWMLIDDCWSQVNTSTLSPWAQGRLYLTGLAADPKKFPGGLGRAVSTLKKDYGVSWVGAWHTFDGYWNGIARDTELGREYADALMPLSEKVAIPDPRSDAGERFWDAWYQLMAAGGIDFVKIDNQGTLAALLQGALPISQAMAQAQHNVQTAAARYFRGNVLNCMEMNIDTVYQWETTNLGRSSVDYTPISYHNPRTNTVTNVMNSLWFAEVSYSDYDMFMTHDGHAEYYGVARAMSGGPVYTTDKAREERFEQLWPLVLADGLVIRADAPGLPIRANILVNPLVERKPLVAFARTGEGGALACWNVDKLERTVKTELRPADVEGVAGERFAVYEYFTGSLRVAGREEKFPVLLARWDIRLYSVMPVVDGFAPLGLTNKYLSPGTVRGIRREPGKVIVDLAEAGPFVAYSQNPPRLIAVNGQPVPASAVNFAEGKLKIEVPKPATPGPVSLEISW